MNALLIAPKERRLLPDAIQPFCVVVIFDGFEARRRVMEVESRLIKQFGQDFGFESKEWRFDQLGLEDAGPEAARMAAGADMVLFASSKEELPDNIKLWIEMWLAKRGEQETALAAIIGTANPKRKPSTPAHRYLETVAQQTGMNYFPAQFRVAKPITACSIEAIMTRAAAVTPLLDEILHQQYVQRPERWGINE